MIDVEARADVPADVDALVRRLRWTCAALGIARASVGLMVVGADEMRAINRDQRGKDEPTDVLAFPIDADDGLAAIADWPEDGPAPELGDIVICPEAAEEPLATLAVHGLLHLVGYDHETDEGEMLTLQDRLVAEAPE